MNAFAPRVPAIPRPSRDELLARFVPSALRRMPPTAKVWSLPKLFVYAALTAGLYSFWPLRTRVRQTLTYQAHHVELASEWLAILLPSDDAELIRRATATVVASGRTVFGGLTALWLIGVASVLVSVTLAIPSTASRWPAAWAGVSPWTPVLMVGVPALSVCYFWLVQAVNRQIVALQQYVLAFNAIFDERVPALDVPPLVWGLRPVSIAAGLVGAAFGPFWVLPMTMAWAAHGEAASRSVRRLHSQLAARITALSDLEPVIPAADLCVNSDCTHTVPLDAAFCPRCGTTKEN